MNRASISNTGPHMHGHRHLAAAFVCSRWATAGRPLNVHGVSRATRPCLHQTRTPTHTYIATYGRILVLTKLDSASLVLPGPIAALTVLFGAAPRINGNGAPQPGGVQRAGGPARTGRGIPRLRHRHRHRKCVPNPKMRAWLTVMIFEFLLRGAQSKEVFCNIANVWWRR